MDPTPVRPDELMRFLDGEVSPDERSRIEAALKGSTELQRELALFRSMKDDLLAIQFEPELRRAEIWERVNRQLTRPIGWVLLLAGAAAWTGYAGYLFFTSPADLLEKLATGAMVIGIILLLVSVIWEQYRAWLTDPYRDIQR
jgi:anti-sigma factor RsiW